MSPTERLHEALNALEEQGDFIVQTGEACCQSCAISEIQEDAEWETKYAFWHLQDAEALDLRKGVLTGKLHISYGSLVEQSKEASEAVGREVEAMLKTYGLKTEWSGDWSHRIAVLPE